MGDDSNHIHDHRLSSYTCDFFPQFALHMRRHSQITTSGYEIY